MEIMQWLVNTGTNEMIARFVDNNYLGLTMAFGAAMTIARLTKWKWDESLLQGLWDGTVGRLKKSRP